MYSVEFDNDKMVLNGSIVWTDGSKYTGGLKSVDDAFKVERHGTGCFTGPLGNIYNGEFKDNHMTGKGTTTRTDGGSFVGGK